MAKKIVISCTCGAVMETEIGFFHRKEICPNCKKVIELKKELMKVIDCPHCNAQSVYDIRNGVPKTCLNCGKELMSPAEKALYRKVACPGCNFEQDLLPGSGVHKCSSCGMKFDVDDALRKMTLLSNEKPVVYEQNDVIDKIVWKFGITSFPYNSQLIVKQGTKAVCTLGGNTLYPGTHSMKEVLSASVPVLTDEQKKGYSFRTDVYFVRDTIDTIVKWGTPNPPTFYGSEPGSCYQVSASGHVMLRISDPRLFLESMGFGEHTAASLITSDINSPLRVLVRGVINDVLFQVCADNIEKGWKVETISANTAAVRTELLSAANSVLAGFGLQATQLAIEKFGSEKSERYNEITKENQELRHQVESGIEWTTPDPLSVHMRDYTSRSAKIRMGGMIILRVLDINRLKDSVQLPYGSSLSGNAVNRHLSMLFSTALMNPLNDVMQAMINETNADIRELAPYYRSLRNIMAEYLNNILREWGAEISVFTLRQVDFFPSEPLRKLTQVVEQKDSMLIDQDMAEFTRKYKFEEANSTANFNNAMRDIASREKHSENQHAILDMQSDDERLDAEAESTIRKIQRENRVNRYLKDVNAENAHIDAQQKAEQELLEIDLIAKITERRGQVDSADQQRMFDQMYVQWQRNARLDHEKLVANMNRDNMIQQHGIMKDQRAYEAVHIHERADADQHRILAGILRKIDESDFDWKQKQDAYDRLLRNQQSDDYARNLMQETRAETDAQYLREHLKIELSDEQAALLEKLAQREEERAERKRRAEFARDMEERRQEIGLQMQLLEIEVEQQDKINAANERLAEQKAEIAKLRLMIDHYEAMGVQDVETTRIHETNATIRSQAESAYKLKHEENALREAAARMKAKEESEEKFADRAQELLTTMWSLDASLEAMKLNNEREYNAGRARVDETSAKRMSDDVLRNLTDRIDGISRRLGSLNERVRTTAHAAQEATGMATAAVAEAASAKSSAEKAASSAAKSAYSATTYSGAGQSFTPAGGSAAPGYNPYATPSFMGGGQTGYATQNQSGAGWQQTATCPFCFKSITPGSSFCPNCGKPLSKGYGNY